MFLTWADHVQACAAEFNLSLGDVRGLLVGSVVVPGGAAASGGTTTAASSAATAGGATAVSTPAPTSTAAPTTAPTTATPATTVGRVVRHRLGGSVYEYTAPGGYWVVVDTCTRAVLKVEYDLDSGALGGWVFTPHAIEDCKALKTTPVVVVPATGSDGRGLRNAVMQVRSSLGVDVRLV